MTTIPSSLLGYWSILRETWYPSVFPSTKTFSVAAWQIATISSDDGPIILRRKKDNKTISISFDFMRKHYVVEQDYISYVQSKGYKLDKKTDSELFFLAVERPL